MELKSNHELANTREKLKLLKETLEAAQSDLSTTEYVRNASVQSLKRLINQLTEEISRFEARQTVRL